METPGIDLGLRFQTGGVWLTVIDVAERNALLIIGKFNSLGEAEASNNHKFWRPFSWVLTRMKANEILDG